MDHSCSNITLIFVIFSQLITLLFGELLYIEYRGSYVNTVYQSIVLDYNDTLRALAL